MEAGGGGGPDKTGAGDTACLPEPAVPYTLILSLILCFEMLLVSSIYLCITCHTCSYMQSRFSGGGPRPGHSCRASRRGRRRRQIWPGGHGQSSCSNLLVSHLASQQSLHLNCRIFPFIYWLSRRDSKQPSTLAVTLAAPGPAPAAAAAAGTAAR